MCYHLVVLRVHRRPTQYLGSYHPAAITQPTVEYWPNIHLSSGWLDKALVLSSSRTVQWWWNHIWVTCWHDCDNGDLGSGPWTDTFGYLVMSWNKMSHLGCNWHHHDNSNLGSAAQVLSTDSVASPHRPDHAMNTLEESNLSSSLNSTTFNQLN